jgi:DUF4097 and DUF4098 domain-containing protein YvlB
MKRKWWIATPLIILLVAVCVCMLAIGIISAQQMGLPTALFRSFQVGDTLAEKEESALFQVGEPAVLVVENPCGDILIRASNQGGITVNTHKKAWGRGQANAEALLAELEVTTTQTGDQLYVGIQNPQTACQDHIQFGRRPEVDFSITVPTQTQVKATARLGKVLLQGTRLPAELHSSFGDISANDLKDKLLVETQNGRLDIQDVDSGMSPISLKSTFGDVSLQRAQASELTITNENGAISLEDVYITGPSTVSTTFGGLTWEGGKSQALTLKSKNGKVTLRDLQASGDLQVSTDFGNIDMVDVSAASYTATTLNGAIKIDGASGRVQAQSDFGDVSVTRAEEVEFHLRSKNGKIYFQGSLGNGPHEAISEFGDIHLVFPSGTAFNFDLQTDFGRIDVTGASQTGSEVTFQGIPDSKHWKGSAFGGGMLVNASTNNGNIIIELK